MKKLSLKSRNRFGRTLRHESLESRRLLSADLSVGAAHAAALVHHETADAVEVGKAQPGKESHDKSGGKHVESSHAEQVSSTGQAKALVALGAAKPLAKPADVSVDAVHAAKPIHQESVDAVKVGKVESGKESHDKSGGKHIESSGAERVSSTSQVKVDAAKSLAKSADVSVDAAKPIHQESVEVGKVESDKESHDKSGGKSIDSSSADHVFATSHVEDLAGLSVTKPLAVSVDVQGSSKSAVRHDDSAGSSDPSGSNDKSHIEVEKADVGSSNDSASDKPGKIDKDHSGADSPDKKPETESENESEPSDIRS